VRVLIDYRPALRERSGAGEYTHQLARALLASGAVDLTIFSSSWKDRLSPGADLAGAVLLDRRIPVRLLNLLWHRAGWPPIEALSPGRFDVVHSSHPLLMPSRDAAQVITIHDLNFLSHPERTRAEIRRDYPALVRGHAQRADAIIVPSAFTAGEVERRLGVAPDRITVCPHGAPDWTPPAAAPMDGYVLFFSTLEPRKNVGGLLDAYERLLIGPAKAGPHGQRDESDVSYVGSGFSRTIPELVLAGKATDDARPWLERIARPPLKGMVRHVGYVEPANRRALYDGARLLVMPSYEEGFGIPVLEAMSAGVPVVAANRGSLPEVLGGAGPLVDPDRPGEIAVAIARLLDDASYAADCVARGLARAREFRWDRTVRRVHAAYEQAIERRRHRGRAA
jgi:glycosyltransferase involved in cell wall biosynthesis